MLLLLVLGEPIDTGSFGLASSLSSSSTPSDAEITMDGSEWIQDIDRSRGHVVLIRVFFFKIPPPCRRHACHSLGLVPTSH